MTTKNLAEFIRERRPAIVAEIKALQAELRQLEEAEAGLNGAARKAIPTIKEMVLDVLRGHRGGLLANEILALIKENYGVTVARESLSPQLTRLSKDDRKIELNGRKWTLV